jgi:Ras family
VLTLWRRLYPSVVQKSHSAFGILEVCSNNNTTSGTEQCVGQREFVNMLPLVCNDAVAILFMFDLSRKSTLNSVKEWYRQARGFNKASINPSTHTH